MTKVKLCGIMRAEDIKLVNLLKPDYVGFVFYRKSKRYISAELACELKILLSPEINAVGVFVDEQPEIIAKLLNDGVIDIAQLHGNESESYIDKLRKLASKPIIKAFRIDSKTDTKEIESCLADFILLDSGSGGTGTVFDWNWLNKIHRPYFLAGGLNTENVHEAVAYHPYAVDVSSGIETEGVKDKIKMTVFVEAVRNTKGR